MRTVKSSYRNQSLLPMHRNIFSFHAANASVTHDCCYSFNATERISRNSQQTIARMIIWQSEPTSPGIFLVCELVSCGGQSSGTSHLRQTTASGLSRYVARSWDTRCWQWYQPMKVHTTILHNIPYVIFLLLFVIPTNESRCIQGLHNSSHNCSSGRVSNNT